MEFPVCDLEQIVEKDPVQITEQLVDFIDSSKYLNMVNKGGQSDETEPVRFKNRLKRFLRRTDKITSASRQNSLCQIKSGRSQGNGQSLAKKELPYFWMERLLRGMELFQASHPWKKANQHIITFCKCDWGINGWIDERSINSANVCMTVHVSFCPAQRSNTLLQEPAAVVSQELVRTRRASKFFSLYDVRDIKVS